MSTITSVRKRCEEPRREGLVMPVKDSPGLSGSGSASRVPA